MQGERKNTYVSSVIQLPQNDFTQSTPEQSLLILDDRMRQSPIRCSCPQRICTLIVKKNLKKKLSKKNNFKKTTPPT